MSESSKISYPSKTKISQSSQIVYSVSTVDLHNMSKSSKVGVVPISIYGIDPDLSEISVLTYSL